ncbi:hypothetical protein M569_17149, partial [Genlisea aurea]
MRTRHPKEPKAGRWRKRVYRARRPTCKGRDIPGLPNRKVKQVAIGAKESGQGLRSQDPSYGVGPRHLGASKGTREGPRRQQGQGPVKTPGRGCNSRQSKAVEAHTKGPSGGGEAGPGRPKAPNTQGQEGQKPARGQPKGKGTREGTRCRQAQEARERDGRGRAKRGDIVRDRAAQSQAGQEEKGPTRKTKVDGNTPRRAGGYPGWRTRQEHTSERQTSAEKPQRQARTARRTQTGIAPHG